MRLCWGPFYHKENDGETPWDRGPEIVNPIYYTPCITSVFLWIISSVFSGFPEVRGPTIPRGFFGDIIIVYRLCN